VTGVRARRSCISPDGRWPRLLVLSDGGAPGPGLRCIAFDRRGHGRSSDPGGGYDFDTLADDVAAIIEGLGLTGVTLVGHSMASGEIARYRRRHGSGRLGALSSWSGRQPFPDADG
jgi:pimeloyl-ACP methyl ester carboxylesterase